MFVHNAVRNDNRVLKEAAALSEAGFAATIVGIQAPGLPDEERLGEVRILRLKAHGRVRSGLKRAMEARQAHIDQWGGEPLRKAAGFLNRNSFRVANRLSWKLEPVLYMSEFGWAAAQRPGELRADIWHAHDLNTLATALYFRTRFGGKVVYDSHEYWLDCNNVYTPFAKRVWEQMERRLIGRVDRTITVSKSIAEKLAAQYGVPEPAVVLNTPENQNAKPDGRLREKFAIQTRRIVVYVGLVTHKRGYEQLIDAAALLPDTTVVLMGPENAAFRASLQTQAARAGVKERIVFAGSVPPDEIQHWIAGADAGVSLGQPGALSYEMALPSKFFEYVFAQVPVVVSDFIELRRLVSAYGIGACVDPADSASIAAGIRGVFESADFAGQAWQARVQRFADEFDWRKHKQVLIDVARGLVPGVPA